MHCVSKNKWELQFRGFLVMEVQTLARWCAARKINQINKSVSDSKMERPLKNQWHKYHTQYIEVES